MSDIEIDAAKLLAIVRDENPLVYELAVRRAVIEQQREVIAALTAATASSDLIA